MKNKSIKRWLSRLSQSSHRKYVSRFMSWIDWLEENGSEFAGRTPDELVELQQKAQKPDDYKILDEVQNYVNSNDKWRYNTKRQIYTVIRSFFDHNRAELPKDKGFRITANEPPVKSMLNVDHIRQLIQSCNKTYRALFITMFQAGMDQQRFTEWNESGYQKLSESLSKNEYPIKIEFQGRKRYRNIKPYFSFIGDDAINAIKAYIRDIRDTLDIKPEHENVIFFTRSTKNGIQPISKSSLSLYWFRHMDNNGVIERKKGTGDHSARYGYNIHEMRDVFRTQWEKTPAKPSVGEHCLGHVGDPLGYEKASSDPKWAVKEYLKAIPWLNILSNPINEEIEAEISKLVLRDVEHQKQYEALAQQMDKIQTLLAIDPELLTNPDFSWDQDDPWIKALEKRKNNPL